MVMRKKQTQESIKDSLNLNIDFIKENCYTIKDLNERIKQIQTIKLKELKQNE